MERILNYLPLISAVIGGWVILNGVLHDVFVLLPGRKYDRDTLRLLMDGHILITCGVLQVLAYSGLKNHEPWGIYVAGIACISLLIYCGMIYPFLKSFGIMFLNVAILGLLVYSWIKK